MTALCMARMTVTRASVPLQPPQAAAPLGAAAAAGRRHLPSRRRQLAVCGSTGGNAAPTAAAADLAAEVNAALNVALQTMLRGEERQAADIEAQLGALQNAAQAAGDEQVRRMQGGHQGRDLMRASESQVALQTSFIPDESRCLPFRPHPSPAGGPPAARGGRHAAPHGAQGVGAAGRRGRGGAGQAGKPGGRLRVEA